MVDNGTVIGHLGVYQDTIKALYIDPKYQGNGLSYKLYNFALNFFDELKSDDAREPSATAIWKNLMKSHPSQITYDKRRDQFIYKKA